MMSSAIRLTIRLLIASVIVGCDSPHQTPSLPQFNRGTVVSPVGPVSSCEVFVVEKEKGSRKKKGQNYLLIRKKSSDPFSGFHLVLNDHVRIPRG